ncbi:MAG: DUF1345 domain-containing protein [Novosphingobium sp.]
MSGLRLGRWIAPPRFLAFLLLLPVGYAGNRALFAGQSRAASLVVAFDVAAAAFLASLVPLLRRSDGDAIRRHAADNDANRWLVLAVTLVLMLVIMVAIAGEIDDARRGGAAAVVTLVATLLLTWLFGNSVYTLHYAHLYYARDDAGNDRRGLDFPGTDEPDYGDFAYFAFTLGMTFQTSDATIQASTIRRAAILHGFAAYLFSIGVIAFTINALGSG